MGKYSIPFADTLLANNVISQQKVTISNILISKTQPVFCVCYRRMLYECGLLYLSCKMITEFASNTSTSTPPPSEGHNYALRYSAIRGGRVTGPSFTVHTSGIIQYQGDPDCIGIVVSSFSNCIDISMESAAHGVCCSNEIFKITLCHPKDVYTLRLFKEA
jgi:hypothetical protein